MVQWFKKTYVLPIPICMIGLLLIGLFFPFTQVTALEPPLPKQVTTNDGSEVSKTILIAGNGPERYLLEILADAFEQRHPSISVDFFW